jgi:folylpolyglutamate synthase/dihydropteroate synthase
MLDILRDGFESISVDSGVSVEFFFTVSAHKSAVDAKLLKDRFGSGEVCAKPTEALESACEFAGNSGVAVVLGSAYLVGDLRPQVIEGPFRTIA